MNKCTQFFIKFFQNFNVVLVKVLTQNGVNTYASFVNLNIGSGIGIGIGNDITKPLFPVP